MVPVSDSKIVLGSIPGGDRLCRFVILFSQVVHDGDGFSACQTEMKLGPAPSPARAGINVIWIGGLAYVTFALVHNAVYSC